MAFILSDRVKETTSTTGTGTYTLGGASTGFESFGSIGNSNTTYYCCTDGTDFEVGIGTYTASGTTLARTTILQSSNSDNAVNWSAGTREIFCTLPAEKSVVKDASNHVSIGEDQDDISLIVGKAHIGHVVHNGYGAFSHYNMRNSTGGYALLQSSNGQTLLNAASGQILQFRRNNSAIGTFETDGTLTLNNGATVNGDLTLTSTDADAIEDPSLILYRNSSSPAVDDELGEIVFRGRNDNSEDIDYVKVYTEIKDETDGTESGSLKFEVMRDGTLASWMTLSGEANQTYVNKKFNMQSNNILNIGHLTFEGSTSDANETTLNVTDPTADRTITLPDVTGTVITTGNLSGITSTGTLTGLTTSGTISLSQTSGTAIKTTGNLDSADLGILRAAGSADTHGFTIKYMGSRSGNNNSYSLFMDNQQSTDVEAMTVFQDGKVGINQTTPTAPLHVGGAAIFDDVLEAGVLEGKGGVTYDPPGSSGTETSTNVGLALHSGKRIVLGEQGFIRTVVDATWASALKIGQSGTNAFTGTEIYGGNNGVTLKYGADTKLVTTSEGIQVTDTGAGSTAVLELGTTSTTEQGMIRLNGSTANKYSNIQTTNGNLHIDSAGTTSHKIYLNWYTSDGNSSTGGTIFGNGNGSQVGVIDGSGNLTITGALSAATKSFDIEHPTKHNMRLKHGSLEGPEHGVYVRGILTDENVIELPDYWTGLVHEDSITAQLTPKGHMQQLYVKEIRDNKVYVENTSATKIDCFYFIQGNRKDTEGFEVEYEN